MLAKLKNISEIALPMMISNLVLITSILINTSILGNYNKIYFYYLALFMPVNYILMAIYEACRITSLNLCQIARIHKQSCLSYVYRLIPVSAFIMLILICSSYFLSFANITLGLKPRQELLFLYFTISMLLSGLFVSFNSIINGSLYAIGKQKVSSMIVFVTSALVCLLNYVFLNHFNFGVFSLAISIILINAFIGVIGVLLLISFEAKREFVENKNKLLTKTINHMAKIGIPIFLVYVVIFFSLIIYNMILSHFGKDVVSAFSIVFKVQNFIMIPGVAFGVSIGIIVNNLFNENKKSQAIEYMQFALVFMAILYFLLSLLVFVFRDYIVTLIVTNDSIKAAAIECLRYYSFAFIGLGPCLMYVCILEQTGYALKSLFINISIFVLQITLGGYFSLTQGNPNVFYAMAVLVNFSGMSYVFFEFFINKKYHQSLSRLMMIERG